VLYTEIHISTMSKNNNNRSIVKTMRTLQTNHEQKEHPPQVNATIQITRIQRYESLANNGTLSITRANVLNHLLMCTLTTTYRRLLSGYLIKSIQIWSPSSGVDTTSTVSVEWLSNYGPSKIVSDVSMSVKPAHVHTFPPKNSLSSFWSLTGSNESEKLCVLTIPEQSIVDIEYSAIFENGETPTLVTAADSGVTGTLYMTFFDGVSTGILQPVSYSSIL